MILLPPSERRDDAAGTSSPWRCLHPMQAFSRIERSHAPAVRATADAGRGGPGRFFPVFAWGVLLYNLPVILWGAYVRATGSGAGCGSHWPLCNGAVIPRPESQQTLIEFSHRLMSGLDGLLVLALFVLAFRLFPRGHRVRS